MPQKFNSLLEVIPLLRIDAHVPCFRYTQCLIDVAHMLFKSMTGNSNVIQVCLDLFSQEVSKHFVHVPTICVRCILQAKRHYCVTERTPQSVEGSEMLVILLDGDGIESTESVQRSVVLESSQAVKYFLNIREWP